MNLQEQARFRDQLRDMKIGMDALARRLDALEDLVTELSERRGPGRPKKMDLIIVDKPK